MCMLIAVGTYFVAGLEEPSGEGHFEEQMEPGPIRSAIEFIGAHPFATGLLAIVGIVGFFLSLAGFVFDREEAASTTRQVADTQEQVASVGDDAAIVREVVTAQCSSPPCWSLRELAQYSTIGRPKDLIDRKLPPPDRREEGATFYTVDGCDVRIEYIDDAVVYFSVALQKDATGSDPSADVTIPGEPCDFSIGLMNNHQVDPSFDEDAGLPPYSELTIKDILTMTSMQLEASDYVFDGGNMMPPYLNFFERGPQSSGNRKLYFTTNFSNIGEPDYSGFRSFARAMNDVEENNFNWQDKRRKGICEVGLDRHLKEHLQDARVIRIGLGFGQRTLDRSGGSPRVVCP